MAKKMINPALQGGGAHGSFTWGVLDNLLEDGRIGMEAVSGTSAGAMNAVVMVSGMMRDGPDGAERLWNPSGWKSRNPPGGAWCNAHPSP